VASDHHPVAVLGLTAVFIVLLVVSIMITRTPEALDPVSRRHERVRRLGLVLALGIPAQAVFGGITVMTRLNPWIVAGHLLVTFVLIAVAMWLVHTAGPAPRPAVGRTGWLLSRLVAVALAVSMWLGTVVTGSGPHSGDETARRTGLDPELMSHIHASAVYLTIGLTLAAVLVLRSRAAMLLLVLEVAQGVVGLVQYWTGLPIVVVMVHMLGSAVLVAAGTHLVWTTGRERPTPEVPVESTREVFHAR
ncbi:MAG TPA: heme A synthase, partial [Bacillota bacterium]|nr:heme A synthase [Bacillota bacterium]